MDWNNARRGHNSYKLVTSMDPAYLRVLTLYIWVYQTIQNNINNNRGMQQYTAGVLMTSFRKKMGVISMDEVVNMQPIKINEIKMCDILVFVSARIINNVKSSWRGSLPTMALLSWWPTSHSFPNVSTWVFFFSKGGGGVPGDRWENWKAFK